MIAHDTYIYHCLTCGRIQRHESDSAVLPCCGQTMTMAATESHPIVDVMGASVPDAPAKRSTATRQTDALSARRVR